MALRTYQFFLIFCEFQINKSLLTSAQRLFLNNNENYDFQNRFSQIPRDAGADYRAFTTIRIRVPQNSVCFFFKLEKKTKSDHRSPFVCSFFFLIFHPRSVLYYIRGDIYKYFFLTLSVVRFFFYT